MGKAGFANDQNHSDFGQKEKLVSEDPSLTAMGIGGRYETNYESVGRLPSQGSYTQMGVDLSTGDLLADVAGVQPRRS